MRASIATHEAWAERVKLWRESGESGRDFARRHGVSSASLYQWAKRVEGKPSTRFLKLVPRSSASTPSADVVVEVGTARVRVARGFDAELLAEVVKALSGAGR